jgi:hypothetical protein
MTIDQVEQMKESGLLFLSKEEEKNHYSSANILRTASFMPLLAGVYSYLTDKKGSLEPVILITVIGFFIFWGFYVLMRKSQKDKLRFTPLNTDLNKSDNYSLTKQALNLLNWTIESDTPEFIKALNPHKDFRTWGDEMVSILILDQKILVNSICNLNKINQAFAYGKNEENVANFVKAFESLLKEKTNIVSNIVPKLGSRNKF